MTAEEYAASILKRWGVAEPHLDRILVETISAVRADALEEAARAVRMVNEAADVPGGNNPRVRSWALECAEIQIRKLKEGPEAARSAPKKGNPHD